MLRASDFKRRDVALLATTTFLFLSAIAVLAVRLSESPDPPPEGPQLLEGQAAPALSLATLDGGTATLSEQAGRVVVLDFWATWCPPCVVSLPALAELANDAELAERGLIVWAVNNAEPVDRVEAFVRERGLSLIVPLDVDAIAMRAFGVTGIPATVVVGRDGTVREAFVGYSDELPRLLREAVEAALAEG